MKQKLRNLSAPANIIFAILAVFIFIALLQWSGKVLGLIPGMEKADDYLLQAIVETVVLVIFLGITYLFGLWDIFKENVAGWTRSLYTGGYLIYNDIFVFIDGRADLYSLYNYEDYLDIDNLSYGYDKLLKKYKFDYILMPKKSGFSTYLNESSEYDLIYSDKKVVIFKVK